MEHFHKALTPLNSSSTHLSLDALCTTQLSSFVNHAIRQSYSLWSKYYCDRSLEHVKLPA